ncbi:MAG: hypothetical protein QM784_13840 [Polyangiaceae bacterium]
MGVHVILDINPHGIDPVQWETAYDETVMLLSQWQPALLGWAVRFIEGIRVPVYTNNIVTADAESPHWCVVGDRDTLRTGECQELHRNLGRYLAPTDASKGPICPNIVVGAARQQWPDGIGPVRVFGDKTQGYPYHFAVLAAAMLIEERFPRHAMVWGDIDAGQAEQAARMAAPILNRTLALPIRVDVPRLLERLGEAFAPAELPEALRRVFLGVSGAQEAVLKAFPGESGTVPWKTDLSSYDSPSKLGVVRLVIDWLNSGRTLADACRLACLDPSGPRYNPVAFIDALASTWVAVPLTARAPLDVFQKPAGATHTVASLFGSLLLDMHASGRHLRIEMSPGEILNQLEQAFGPSAVTLARRLFERSADIEVSLSEQAQDVAALVEAAQTTGSDDTDNLVTLDRIDAIGANQLLWLQATAWKAARAISELRALASQDITLPSTARRFIAKVIAINGPTLTEDAWACILAEESPEVLTWYMALVSIPAQELHLSQVRRALLENAKLLRHAMAIAKDAGQMRVIEELVRRPAP